MENKNEIIINDNIKTSKAKKQLTEAQKEKQRETMRNYYLKNENQTLNILNVKDCQVKHIITSIKKKYYNVSDSIQRIN